MAASQPNLRSAFAERLKKARLAAGLSQRELGRRIGLPEEVVSSRITRYERGTSEPDFATAEKLARELEVPLAYLLADNDLLADIILAVSTLPLAEQRKLAADLKARKK
jgi:transcriptional regulator with XRE-family HTH domain